MAFGQVGVEAELFEGDFEDGEEGVVAVGGEVEFGALEMVKGVDGVFDWKGVGPEGGALARGEGGEGELAVMIVGNSEERAEAKAEEGRGEVELPLNEVSVEGAGGTWAAEGAQADAVERGREVALWVDEEGGDESVRYVEEEGLGVPLGAEVEVGEGWSSVGIADACGKGEAVAGSGLGGDGGCCECGIGDDCGEEVASLGDKGDVGAGGRRGGLQVWDELWAGAEDG